MSVLVRLAGSPSQVVSREDLLADVWEGVFVSDEVLSTAIRKLRSALGDDAKAPTFIQTVPGVGYRLIARVSGAEVSSENAVEQPGVLDVSRARVRRGCRSSFFSRLPWCSGLLFVVSLQKTRQFFTWTWGSGAGGLSACPLRDFDSMAWRSCSTSAALVDGRRVLSRRSAPRLCREHGAWHPALSSSHGESKCISYRSDDWCRWSFLFSRRELDWLLGRWLAQESGDFGVGPFSISLRLQIRWARHGGRMAPLLSAKSWVVFSRYLRVAARRHR